MKQLPKKLLKKDLEIYQNKIKKYIVKMKKYRFLSNY